MSEEFKVANDKEADDLIVQIREAEEERDRLIALAKDQIADLYDKISDIEAKCDNATAFLKSRLGAYLDTVKAKETKTQRSYKLLSGTLVLKKPSFKITHNDEKLIEYLENNEGSKFIKVKKSVDWAEFKKELIVSDNDEVIDADLGIIIPADVCGLEEVPASFGIKF